MRSILKTEKGTCYICHRSGFTHEHHIFHGTANRKKAEEWGMKVDVCPDCHNKIHTDPEWDSLLKEHGEHMWMIHYKKGIEEFIAVFGKSYLTD